MSEIAQEDTVDRGYWPRGMVATIAKGLTGLLAIFVALKAAAYEPSLDPMFAHQDHVLRIMAFAALTVWTCFTIGVQRRGAAAMITLGFAIFVEMILVPIKHEGMSTIVSANLGIVFAYCAMNLYWIGLKTQGMPTKG